MANAGVKRKLFTSRGCQAVRLPKGCEFEGTEVRICGLGKWVFLSPVAPDVDVEDINLIRGVIDELRPHEPGTAAMMDRELQKATGSATGTAPQG
jgi:virulence-associated protein VagC